MERLFSKCTRVHDILESQGRLKELRGSRELLQELNLDVSTEEFLSAEKTYTYSNLYAMLGSEDKIAWLSPHAAVARRAGRVLHSWKLLDGLCRFSYAADGKEIHVLARSSEHLLEICDIVLRLLAASVVHSLLLRGRGSHKGALIHAPTLACLMELCKSLETLKLENLEMDEDKIRVLGAYSRPGLRIELTSCKLTNAGTSALVEVLGRNQGPTDLHYCDIDYNVLADGLRGNSRLKSLSPFVCNSPRDDNRELQAIASALKDNKGLVRLNLSGRRRFGLRVSDETWDAICDSLKTHATLEVLNLSSTNNDATTPTAVIISRVQALLEMVKLNLSIHTIHLDSSYSEHELFRQSVIPYLEANQLRARIRAIQKARSIPCRTKVLGRALLSTRTDANSVWMLLSGNPEAYFLSRTTTIAAAANPPTPTTAAAAAAGSTAKANAPDVTTSLMSALLATATSRFPSDTAANTCSTFRSPTRD